MALTYPEIVEILKISQDFNPARDNRFDVFERAVSFYCASVGLVLPEQGRGVILIAGTNGKGSVAKTLETLLCLPEANAGAQLNVGLYTSPHLQEPLERIRSGGRDLSPDEMVQAYELIRNSVESFGLSHFEILTLVMIEVFFGGRIRPRVDVAIIEVGVGGRLDPTRVVPHETCVVTSIGLDHEAILGSTVDAIALEKFAIVEGAQRLIYAPQVADVSPVIAAKQAEFPSVGFFEAPIFPSTVSMVNGEPRWTLMSPWGAATLSLLGARAVENASVALEVLYRCGFDVARLLRGLAVVVWPGRMERVTFAGRVVYLSGDHNEAGVRSLIELAAAFEYERLWIVVGVGRGKPLETMLSLYLGIPRVSVVLTLTSFRAMTVEELSPWRTRVTAIVADPIDALTLACASASPRDLVIVSGSLYLVGDVRARIHPTS